MRIDHNRACSMHDLDPAQQLSNESAILEDFFCRIVARCTGDAAAGMGTRAAHVEALERPAIVAIAQERPCCPELIQRHGTVHDVAANQAKLTL